jgi:DedD protein
MSDEGFHEIQLNGKQLVFLFMAATVVSVVIFLCGVMVGRGVRDRTVSVAAPETPGASPMGGRAPAGNTAERTAPAPEAANGSGQAAPAATPPAALAPPAGQAPPTPPQEDDDYYKDLVSTQKERQGAARSRQTPAPVKAPEPAAANRAASSPPTAAVSPPAPAERTSMASGYAVQLAAVRERSEADAIAKRLVSKGYQAYVLVPQPGKPPVYRVQVGRFKSRGEADRIASRLRKTEQFKPWVTR